MTTSGPLTPSSSRRMGPSVWAISASSARTSGGGAAGARGRGVWSPGVRAPPAAHEALGGRPRRGGRGARREPGRPAAHRTDYGGGHALDGKVDVPCAGADRARRDDVAAVDEG